MNCQPPIQLQQDDIAEFCRKWRIRELSLFGSALRDDFGPESDVDFLVSYEPAACPNLAALVAIKEELSSRCGRPVDLIEKETMRNPWRRREILKTRKVIYAV